MFFILAGPSGVSKSYLCWEVSDEFNSFYLPKKCTTRARRQGEDDREYIFVKEEEFRALSKDGQFEIETEIYGNRYGLLKADILPALQGTKTAIFVLDVFLAQKFREQHANTVLIYIMPLEQEHLARYIRERSQQYGEQYEPRVVLLQKELEQRDAFDYVIPFVNSETAYELLRYILIAERCRPKWHSSNMCRDQTFQFRNSPRLAVDLVLIRNADANILLIERWKEPHGWALPGGFVQHGESVERALQREAKEEIGIVPERPEFIGIFSDPDRDPRMHVVSLSYLALVSTTQEIGRAGGDARQMKWFPVSELPSPIAFDHLKIISVAVQQLRRQEVILSEERMDSPDQSASAQCTRQD